MCVEILRLAYVSTSWYCHLSLLKLNKPALCLLELPRNWSTLQSLTTVQAKARDISIFYLKVVDIVLLLLYLSLLLQWEVKDWNPTGLYRSENEVSHRNFARLNSVHHLHCVLEIMDAELREVGDLFISKVLH